MGIDLVSLAVADRHCRAEPNDPLLPLYITAASRTVLQYLGAADFLDDNGQVPVEDDEPVVPADVKAAALLIVGDLYSKRDTADFAQVGASFGYGFMPPAAIALLYSYRRPVIA